MKKNIIAGILLLALCSVTLSACGKNNTAASSDVSVAEVTDDNEDAEENNLTTDNTENDEETSSDRGGVNTTLSGNVLTESVGTYQVLQTSFMGNTNCDRTTIQTVTFLDSLNDMPSDAWDASKNEDGSVMAWLIENDNGMYDLYIAGEGGVDANSSSSEFFSNFTNLEVINFNDCFCTSNVRNMSNFFCQCEAITSLDLSSFDTSNVTNMSGMFSQCTSLIDLNVSNFDTSNVTDTSCMFSRCESLTNVDISSFDMSKVKYKSAMFLNCPAGD